MTPFQPHPEPTDATINRVLQALRDTDAPTGLEARILHNLQHAAQATPQSRLRPTTLWTRLAPWRWPLNLRLAAVAIPATALFFLAITHKAHLVPLQPPTDALNQPSIFTTTQPTTSPAIQSTNLQPPSHISSPRPSTAAFAAPAAPALSPEDQLALEETNAPSLAAPPPPLTAQERLLLRAARPGSAIEVAELDQVREPLLRAAATARNRATLQRYADGIIAPLLAFPNTDAPSTSETPQPAPTTDPQPQSQSQTSSR